MDALRRSIENGAAGTEKKTPPKRGRARGARKLLDQISETPAGTCGPITFCVYLIALHHLPLTYSAKDSQASTEATTWIRFPQIREDSLKKVQCRPNAHSIE